MLKVGTKIFFHNLFGVYFEVVFLDRKEIRLKKLTRPFQIIAGEYKDNKIKLMGWKQFVEFKIIS